MNPETAGEDEVENLLHPDFTSVILFQGASGYEAAIVNGKHEGIEQWFISRIERAIDEDILIVFPKVHPSDYLFLDEREAPPFFDPPLPETLLTALDTERRLTLPPLAGLLIDLLVAINQNPFLSETEENQLDSKQ